MLEIVLRRDQQHAQRSRVRGKRHQPPATPLAADLDRPQQLAGDRRGPGRVDVLDGAGLDPREHARQCPGAELAAWLGRVRDPERPSPDERGGDQVMLFRLEGPDHEHVAIQLVEHRGADPRQEAFGIGGLRSFTPDRERHRVLR